MTKTQVNRFALIQLPYGASCYGTGPDDAVAVRRAVEGIADFKSVIGTLKKDARVTVTLYDYEPYSHITWEGACVEGCPEGSDKYAPIQPLRVVTADRAGNIL